MQYDFLKNFPKRMKNVGLYSLLVQNSFQKTTWKQYGFIKSHEQINMIFAVLLYIMEQSLKEENCTLDDIGAYIDTLNMQYLRKNISYEECKELGDFIVNTILCNEGRPMYFEGFDFEQGAYQRMNVSYVANRVVYIDGEIKRTSYYLTDDGYSLLLSTLEVESNMKLTIHEMIFQMHLEKQSYDKAVDEIKNVFNLLRIQLQKIQEAMSRIRRNGMGAGAGGRLRAHGNDGKEESGCGGRFRRSSGDDQFYQRVQPALSAGYSSFAGSGKREKGDDPEKFFRLQTTV